MPDKGGVADALAQQLQTKGVEVLRIKDAPDPDALTNSLKELAGRRAGARSLLAFRAGLTKEPLQHGLAYLA